MLSRSRFITNVFAVAHSSHWPSRHLGLRNEPILNSGLYGQAHWHQVCSHSSMLKPILILGCKLDESVRLNTMWFTSLFTYAWPLSCGKGNNCNQIILNSSLYSLTYSTEEFLMLINGKIIKEDIVLWTRAQTFPYFLRVFSDVGTISHRSSWRTWEQA